MSSALCCTVSWVLFVLGPAVSAVAIVLFANYEAGAEFGSSGHFVGGAENWTVASRFTVSSGPMTADQPVWQGSKASLAPGDLG